MLYKKIQGDNCFFHSRVSLQVLRVSKTLTNSHFLNFLSNQLLFFFFMHPVIYSPSQNLYYCSLRFQTSHRQLRVQYVFRCFVQKFVIFSFRFFFFPHKFHVSVCDEQDRLYFGLSFVPFRLSHNFRPIVLISFSPLLLFHFSVSPHKNKSKITCLHNLVAGYNL